MYVWVISGWCWQKEHRLWFRGWAVALKVSAPAIKTNASSVFSSGECALENSTQKIYSMRISVIYQFEKIVVFCLLVFKLLCALTRHFLTAFHSTKNFIDWNDTVLKLHEVRLLSVNKCSKIQTQWTAIRDLSLTAWHQIMVFNQPLNDSSLFLNCQVVVGF